MIITRMHCSLFVLVVYSLALTTGLTCTRPSTRPSITSPKLNIPVFSADVEIYKKEIASIIFMKVYYQQYAGMIHLSFLQNDHKDDMFFYFKDDEFLHFTTMMDQSRPICEVYSQMHKNPYTTIVGGTIYNAQKKQYQIPPALNVFHFSGKDAKGQDIYPQYIGKTKIRGKDVYEYQSCQTWMQTEIGTLAPFQAKVTHYFTHFKDTANWKYPVPSDMAIPVSMRVQGTGSSTVDQTWNFFNIRPEVPPYSLETPPGVVCPKRQIDKPFPKLPNFLKMTYEVINNMGNNYRVLNEVYDDVQKYTVVRTTPKTSTLIDEERIVTIDDFYSGLSYQIDEVTSSCSVTNITARYHPFYYNNKGIAELYSPKIAFMGVGGKFSYLGQKNVRGMPCDTWVGYTWNKDLKNITAEWYFAVNGTKSWNSQSNEKNIQIPVKLRIWKNQNTLIFLPPGTPDNFQDFNVFHVDYTKTLVNSVSIRPCLLSSPKNIFNIIFPGVPLQKAEKLLNIQNVEWIVLNAIAKAAGVRFLRISDFQLIHNNTNLIAYFILLDAPPYAGDRASTIREPSLTDAIASLTKAITSGKLKVILQSADSSNTVTITASKDFFSQPAWTNSGKSSPWTASQSNNKKLPYSGGAMAALGIVMLAVGLASGGGGSYYLIYKRQLFD